ncbi:hypothetical protein GNQ08_20455 [Paenibacillus macerans]|uniref:Uncharacterized protein n=1 Tax=Paenibacillus macerans TaxID=44252 RepID=A0A6N8F1F8_PAEMA|nr:hypothetical protein [Paenibacillus macerans]MUG24743.1 hypothetical protein [Paenibacillus macerans]
MIRETTETLEIKETPADTVELSTGDVCWLDKEEHVLLIYRLDTEPLTVKVKGKADILKLRDMFNAAYPPGNEWA